MVPPGQEGGLMVIAIDTLGRFFAIVGEII